MCVCVCAHACVYVCGCVGARARARVCVCVCVRVCMRACVLACVRVQLRTDGDAKAVRPDSGVGAQRQSNDQCGFHDSPHVCNPVSCAHPLMSAATSRLLVEPFPRLLK